MYLLYKMCARPTQNLFCYLFKNRRKYHSFVIYTSNSTNGFNLTVPQAYSTNSWHLCAFPFDFFFFSRLYFSNISLNGYVRIVYVYVCFHIYVLKCFSLQFIYSTLLQTMLMKRNIVLKIFQKNAIQQLNTERKNTLSNTTHLVFFFFFHFSVQ